ncbi:hypothetical protein C8R48DRAFT_678339 [Suillus tomentosus]|nr:hypothetical protein C8R48DRAFT_678339 [Suillus tomentosus]
MVRPLIYNTPEEKKNAARVYRRTYYERKKEEISVKMAAKYQVKKMASQIMDSGGASSIDISSPPHHDSSSTSGRHMQTPPKLSRLTNIHVTKLSRPVICDIDDAEASLLTCLIFNTLYAQMIRGPGDQQIVLAMLSVRLEVLESIQEYVRLCHGGESRFSAAIMEHLSNLSYQCKLVTAATEELWCYAAVSGSFTPQHISSHVCAMHSSRVGLRVGLKKKFCFLVTSVGIAVRKCRKELRTGTEKVWREFFERWPERSIILAQVPADQGLTEEQESLLKAAVSKRQKQITSWYRWQTNVSCLSRTSGAKGLLKFDAVLAGGVGLSGTRAPKKMHIYSHEYYAEKVRIDADQAIHENNIAHRGAKLNKRLAVTQKKFEAESDEVKEEVEKKYRKVKAKFAKARERLKGGKMPKIDTNAKVKAIRELGPMLDRIFRYLSYATGSWKFSVLMAGPDPTKGGTAVYDYHIGELGNGAQFNMFCEKFNGIQQAFLEFTDRALEFEATLPQNDSDSDLESDDNSDNETNNIQTNSMEGRAEAGSMNLNFHMDDSLYRISPDLFNNESQEHSALFDNAGQGFLLHEHQQQSTLPDQAFQYPDLNFGQTDLDPSMQALIAGSDTQVQRHGDPNASLGFIHPSLGFIHPELYIRRAAIIHSELCNLRAAIGITPSTNSPTDPANSSACGSC